MSLPDSRIGGAVTLTHNQARLWRAVGGSGDTGYITRDGNEDRTMRSLSSKGLVRRREDDRSRWVVVNAA